jgi:RNA polymerase II subunit A small phosphatase-like protein
MFHPSNAIAVTSWFNDPNDKELFELIPFLKDLITVDNVTLILNKN